jgi:hypothetical protein
MIAFFVLLQHSLVYGAILSVLICCIVFGSFFICPRIWLDSAPAAVRQVVGAMSVRERQAKRVVSLVTVIGVLALIVQSVVRLIALGGGYVSFLDIALSVFLLTQVFNIIDLLLIDWLLLVTIRPSFLMFPGTEHLADDRDYGFHFRGFLKGVFGSLIVSLIVASITRGVMQVFGA